MTDRRETLKSMLNKVPEITLYFWIIKVLCTTVGETFADYINETLGFGLTHTTYLMGLFFIIVLCVQFRGKKYIPSVYWLTVVLISVVGTLITDNLTDALGIPLVTTTIAFATALSLTFIGWYARERSLSVHDITTTPREAWYWLTILFTFALGTAAGDLIAEHFDVGYFNSIFLFSGLIGLVWLAHYADRKYLGMLHKHQTQNAVLAFWMAYILTRPLGASIGDYLSQPADLGGLALGTTVTSGIFLFAILALVVYLTATKHDVIKDC